MAFGSCDSNSGIFAGDRVVPLDEVGAMLGRNVQQVGDDCARQGSPERGQELDFAAFGEFLDEANGHLSNQGFQRADSSGCEPTTDEAAVAAVARGIVVLQPVDLVAECRIDQVTGIAGWVLATTHCGDVGPHRVGAR